MTNHLLNDPSHWRERAKAMRVHAEQIDDPESKGMMLKIADDYESLAQRAEARMATNMSPQDIRAQSQWPSDR
jgi:hypothetical protein